MSESIILRWRPYIDRGTPDPDFGHCYDGDMAVGVVRKERPYYRDGSEWVWSMFVTGFVVRPHQHVRRSGRGHTKEAAKAAVENVYRDALSLHPESRAAALAHHARVQESARLFDTGEGRRRARETELERVGSNRRR